ncbi:DUF2269 family protein [Propionivibrio soli]|uniref:DUF2269 family protein n=1 Tax=Propionivibrio soli TaxID=2976531 RepID=UPI0021E7518F|nr:DUF2269 domain-containing protein [Propionivibrio soli]
MDYTVVKWVHILSSTLLFGTGIGSAFYMLFVSLKAEPKAVAILVRYVVRADWLFTAPTVILQPLSGFYLAHLAGFPMTSKWIVVSSALFGVAVVAWLPVVWMQIRMRDLAQQAVEQDRPLPKRYWRYLELWSLLGMVAFFALVAIFWLMVGKPA